MNVQWMNDKQMIKTVGDYQATCSGCGGLADWLIICPPVAHEDDDLDLVLGFRCTVCKWEMRMTEKDVVGGDTQMEVWMVEGKKGGGGNYYG